MMQTSKCELCNEKDASLPPSTYLLTCHQCFRSWHSTCCIPPIHDEIMADLRAKIGGLSIHNWQCKTCGDIQLRRFRYGGPEITYVYWSRARKVGTNGTWGHSAWSHSRRGLIKAESPDGNTLPGLEIDDDTESDDSSNSATTLSGQDGRKRGLTTRKLRSFMTRHLTNKNWNCQKRVMKRDMKFWNGKAREVKVGAEIRKRPIRLADLCGQYRWVYERHKTFELKAQADSDCESEADDQHVRNYLELCLPEEGELEESIRGNFRFENVAFSFAGTVPKKETTNVWEVGELDVEGAGIARDATITALEVTDDSGNPFLQFEWVGEGCGSLIDSTRSSLVGKKELAGEKWEPLSVREQDELGIEIDERVTRAVGMLLDDAITRHCFVLASEDGLADDRS